MAIRPDYEVLSQPDDPEAPLAELGTGRFASATTTARVIPNIASLASALRWAALLVAFAICLIQRTTPSMVLAGGVLLGYSLVRSFWPIDCQRSGVLLIGPLLLEVGIGAAAVETTGLERSPFLLFLAAATLFSGYAGGLTVLPGLVAIATLSVVVPTFSVAQDRVYAGQSIEFATLLLLVAVVGGYARLLLDRAGLAGLGMADQVEQLSDVNSLLLDLHAATERAAAPLDVNGAARWVLERIDETFGADTSAVLLRDPIGGYWRVAASRGFRELVAGDELQLRPFATKADGSTAPVRLEDHDGGVEGSAVWGLYAPVRTRNELTGMLLLESRTPRPYSEVEDRRLQGLAAAAGLAVDNARWLERIHRVGVEQERSRIARELHDHVGQSMAYLGIELDRLVKMNHGRAVQHDLRVLRQDVRTLVQELRDTLVDLRTDVSEQRDVGAVIRSLADRVNRRGGVAVKCSLVAQSRLPIAVEREVWRIAQEAVINAEKHARATRIDITWLCNEHWALLEVTDDGVGLAPDASTVPGRYGLVGMRERADCIGADLTFESWPGKGTTVRLQIEQRAEQCAS